MNKNPLDVQFQGGGLIEQNLEAKIGCKAIKSYLKL